MKNQTKNYVSRRETYDKALPYYAEVGIVPQRAKIKVIGELKDGADRVRFDITKLEGAKHAIEMLLGKTDLFVGTAIGVGLMIEADATPGLHPIYSYPVQAGKHLPAALKGFENGNAIAIYNGKWIMRTGSTLNQSRWPLDECLYIPETQPVQIVNFGATDYVPAGLIPAFHIDNLMVQLEERPVFTGTKSQPLEIEFPLVADFGVPEGCKAYAVLIIDGWILETGATEEMKKEITLKDGRKLKNPYADTF